MLRRRTADLRNDGAPSLSASYVRTFKETSAQQTLGNMLLSETYLLNFIRMLRLYYVRRRNWV